MPAAAKPPIRWMLQRSFRRTIEKIAPQSNPTSRPVKRPLIMAFTRFGLAGREGSDAGSSTSMTVAPLPGRRLTSQVLFDQRTHDGADRCLRGSRILIGEFHREGRFAPQRSWGGSECRGSSFPRMMSSNGSFFRSFV